MKSGKAYNGEEHGKLYSPEFAAVHINTTEQQQEKGKDAEPNGQPQGQGELYSPETAIHLPKKRNSQNHQLKEGKDEAETKEKQSAAAAAAAAADDDECMPPKPSSKL